MKLEHGVPVPGMLNLLLNAGLLLIQPFELIPSWEEKFVVNDVWHVHISKVAYIRIPM